MINKFGYQRQLLNSQRELETESIISNFISHTRYDTELKYNYLEIYDAIEDMFELLQYYKMKGKIKNGNSSK
ncbi:MAG: hypothetical protein IKF82_05360 [Bacilli bacterium]|nr:hypothetical protein [Bacilli bacterium]